ncbi:cytochrome c1 [Sphingomonas sp. SORGH_AS_0879]|uniref:cytochrome c1 n=1 Tax=Sphingomonas sp. SORGH_AS_0879 TaxID=3041790 RepID=UPI0027870E7E|nr:cytochrome c1 [Sphingomonas sp. SORGH_AS_0879]MDQ1232077.1 ubiquinol-cytochrome c reductase cytochrome c1 subunit [Sphingomonas sp. SORGH_AS_0879]
MVRGIAFLVGAAFTLVLAIALWGSVSGLVSDPPAPTAEEEFHLHPKSAHLASDGILGRFDRRQLQRGFQVYKEVCAACHSLRLVAFRDLKDLGYNEAEVKAIANQWVIEQPSINPETGEATTRKNVPADRFPSPFANEVAARAANNNALPPDLSLMTKARHDGTNYVYSLIGPDAYRNQPAELLRKFPDVKTPTGLHYNPYFANLNIAMPPPLTQDGQVQYTDGTLATRDQMAKDVAAFLTWTAEPRLESRHAAGIGAVIFILIFCFLAWGAYQNVWRDVKH